MANTNWGIETCNHPDRAGFEMAEVASKMCNEFSGESEARTNANWQSINMKLLYCKKCDWTFWLRIEDTRCPCGCCFGIYTDNPQAIWGEKEKWMWVPFAVDNASFLARSEPVRMKPHNIIYDQWYGSGKIQCWIFRDKKSINADQMTKVDYSAYIKYISSKK